MTLARFTAETLNENQIQELVQKVLTDFSSMFGLRTILLFGSAATGTMTNASDLDIVLIFDTQESTTTARKLAPSLRKEATWPMDLLCVDVETFRRKSEIGGIYFVARDEGKVIYGEMP